MLQGLRNGTYQALVLDEPVVKWIAGTNQECDLFTVGDTFEIFSLALAFPIDYAGIPIDSFTFATVRLQVMNCLMPAADLCMKRLVAH